MRRTRAGRSTSSTTVRRQGFSERAGVFVTEALVRFLVQLRRRRTWWRKRRWSMVFLDLLSLFQDLLAAPEVDVGGCQVAEALVVAAVVVVVDEGADLALEIAGQEVMLEQDAVLHGLVPAFDLALGLGVVGAPRTCSMPLSSM